MQQFAFARFSRVIAALAVAAVLGAVSPTARAVELGEPVVRTHIGQPLVADIELTMLSDSATPVLVRIAHPDVFRGANIAMHPLLSTLNLSVMRRDGRQFLHITSVKPLEAEYLHLFLNLTQGGKTDVRAATLWLTPDPTPPAPPPVAAAPVAQAAPAVAPSAAPAAKPAAPSAAPAKAAAAPRSAGLSTAQQLAVCATLDYKNGMLSAQIVELEEKVKQLQLAMESKAVAVPEAAPLAPVVKGPVPIKPAAPVKKVAPPPEPAGFPWLLAAGVGVAALALLGAAVFVLLRRRKKKGAASPGATGDEGGPLLVPPEDRADYMAKLKESLQRKKKAPKPE